MAPAAGSMLMLARIGMPPGRQPADGFGHHAFAVAQPLCGERLESVPAKLLAEREHLPFSDSRRTDQGQIVAPPLIGHPDPEPAGSDQIL